MVIVFLTVDLLINVTFDIDIVKRGPAAIRRRRQQRKQRHKQSLRYRTVAGFREIDLISLSSSKKKIYPETVLIHPISETPEKTESIRQYENVSIKRIPKKTLKKK